jgi:polyA polymerase
MLIYQKVSDKTLKKLIINFEEKNLKRLFNLFSADLNSKNINSKEENQKILYDFLKRIENLKKQGNIPSIKDLDLTGIDLINLKFENREIGKLKNELYELVLSDELKNEKEELIKYLAKKYNLCQNFKHENSCGAIVFNNKIKKFLIVKMFNGNWGFPKGHIEECETEVETAIREVFEETGIKINIVSDKKYEIKYVPNETTIKKVTFFIGITENEKVTVDEQEIEAYKWCSYEEALKTITYRLQKEVLENSYKILKQKNLESLEN